MLLVETETEPGGMRRKVKKRTHLEKNCLMQQKTPSVPVYLSSPPESLL